jgi:hypothetical protein
MPAFAVTRFINPALSMRLSTTIECRFSCVTMHCLVAKEEGPAPNRRGVDKKAGKLDAFPPD